MDIKPQSTKPISDDQELAKVLAGVTNINNGYEATPLPTPGADTPKAPDASEQPKEEPAKPEDNSPVNISVNNTPKMTVDGGKDLQAIKKDALTELRPLVEKLNLSPEEKFDVYLLLLRSSDDKSLIEPAYTAAHAIVDETKRAQALLDIIKEIDYFSSNDNSAS